MNHVKQTLMAKRLVGMGLKSLVASVYRWNMYLLHWQFQIFKFFLIHLKLKYNYVTLYLFSRPLLTESILFFKYLCMTLCVCSNTKVILLNVFVCLYIYGFRAHHFVFHKQWGVCPW